MAFLLAEAVVVEVVEGEQAERLFATFDFPDILHLQ